MEGVVAFGSRAAHPDDVLKQMLAVEPAPVVLLAGGTDKAGVEPWYVDEALRRLTAHALGDASTDFNLDRLRAEEAGADVVIGKAETLPMMAKRRVVTVSDVDRWRAADQERMLAWLKRPVPSTTLVFSSTKLDRRYAFAKALEASPQVWRFRKLEVDELFRALIASAKKQGKRLDPSAAEEMVRRAGEDLRLLLTELDKLVSFVGDERAEVVEDDVALATAGAGMSDVFAYADALGRGDLAGALERLRIVMDAGSSAYELIGGLGWHFRTMLRAKAGGPMFGRRMEDIARAAKGFPTRALLEAHKEIYRADVSLKAAQGPTGLQDEAVMDRLTRRICSLRA